MSYWDEKNEVLILDHSENIGSYQTYLNSSKDKPISEENFLRLNFINITIESTWLATS